jgi:hypothetical protein
VTHQFNTAVLQIEQVRAGYRRSYRQQWRWQLWQQALHAEQKHDDREADSQSR